MYRSLRYLVLALVLLLGLYPIAELTRVILVSGMYYFPEMQGQLYAEVAIMWILYLSIVPVFLFFNSRSLRYVRKHGRAAPKPKAPDTEANSITRSQAEYIPIKYIR